MCSSRLKVKDMERELLGYHIAQLVMEKTESSVNYSDALKLSMDYAMKRKKIHEVPITHVNFSQIAADNIIEKLTGKVYY